MQEFEDAHGDVVKVADQLDSDRELAVYTEMGSTASTFYFDPSTSRALGLAIFTASGGNVDSSGPVLASTVSFNEGLLRLATVHGKTVRFDYTKKNSSYAETRRFKPQSCTGTGEHFRFVGPARDRADQPRSFRLDRIQSTVEILP